MFRKTFFVLLFMSYTLIVFTQERENTSFPRLNEQEQGAKRVLMDFPSIAEKDLSLSYNYGASLGIQLEGTETAQLEQSYDISNWKVSVQSSLQYPQVLAKSIVKLANVTGGIYQGQQVLGIRAYFPNYNYDMAIEVMPPYSPFNAILQDGGFNSYENKGYLSNVGDIYKVTITVYGLRQEEHIFVVTEDSDGNTYEYPFGALNFIGWRELVWENPNYLIKDTATRTNLPIYPRYSSDLVLKSIKIVHSSYHKNPDFVSYIRDINFIVDQAEISIDDDIDSEEIWEIIKENTYEKRSTQIKALDMKLYFDFLEERKGWDYSLKNNINSDSANNGN